MDICPCCKLARSSTSVRYYDGSLDDLREATRLHCPRCSFVLKCVDWAVPRLFKYEDITKIRVWENYPCSIYLHNGWIDLDLFTLSGRMSTPLNINRVRSLLPGTTSSQSTFDIIDQWIKECTSGHTRCGSRRPADNEGPQYPKRILDLSNDLVVLGEDYQPQRYACLSHCWGPATEIVKTTVDKLDDFKRNIPWAALTNSFQHAIEICRRLGIFFLWIDSLCIIQDSDDDWKEQAANMANIYENAFITIAATKAKNSSIGCFSKTEPVFLADPLPGYEDVYIRQEPPKYPTHWSQRDGSEIWPLLNRGWIYQEMRLSPRILHFCAQEVMWECSSARRSESKCSDEDLGQNSPRYAHTMYDSVPYWKLAENPMLLWYRTVQEYTRLKLTFEKDKLSALAALTQRMEDMRNGDRFLAGLWEKTLLYDLLWMAWPDPKDDRPNVGQAPTWSWTSVKAQVLWHSDLKAISSSVQVTDIDYVTVGPSHMGNIINARITLRASLIKIKDWHPNQGSRISIGEDDNSDVIREITVYDYKRDYAPRLTKQQDNPFDVETYILPIGYVNNKRYLGIVVRRRQDSSNYERLGLVELIHRDDRAASAGASRPTDRRSRSDANFRRMESIIENLPPSIVTLV